ncbi:cysteine-rich receptor-like protein kinase 8 [Tanacetum coccineum]|uniref:Cysteine-rich receptor-like protein kinase 8 n=1 Tax=Tanacetum coccineum TaxID=301880 RepID=A0ABQ5I777_9ASTR
MVSDRRGTTFVPYRELDGILIALVARFGVVSRIPQGYSHSLSPNTICKLTKSLYGLEQANRQWFEKLTTFLISIGFKQSYVDTSLFSLNKDGKFTSLLVYVDDILIADNDKKTIQENKANLNEKFNIKDLGTLHYYLGIKFLRNLKGLAMTQRKYATDLITYTGLLHSKPLATPLDPIEHCDWASCPYSRRSVIGYGVFLGSSLISKKSKKQLVISRSSTEVEYKALADTTCEVTWLKCLLKEFQDKNIEIDCHFVRNKVKEGVILPTNAEKSKHPTFSTQDEDST